MILNTYKPLFISALTHGPHSDLPQVARKYKQILRPLFVGYTTVLSCSALYQYPQPQTG